MPHVTLMRLYRPRQPSDYSRWEAALQRKNFNVSKYTLLCGNHFKNGKPTDNDPFPELYLDGYPKWALNVTQVKEAIKEISLPLMKKDILKDLIMDLHPKIAREIAASQNLEMVNKTNVIPELSDIVNYLDDPQLSAVFNVVIGQSAPCELHAAVVSHITEPEASIYRSSFNIAPSKCVTSLASIQSQSSHSTPSDEDESPALKLRIISPRTTSKQQSLSCCDDNTSSSSEPSSLVNKASSSLAKKASSPFANKASSSLAKKASSPLANKASSPLANKASSPLANKASTSLANKASSPLANKASSSDCTPYSIAAFHDYGKFTWFSKPVVHEHEKEHQKACVSMISKQCKKKQCVLNEKKCKSLTDTIKTLSQNVSGKRTAIQRLSDERVAMKKEIVSLKNTVISLQRELGEAKVVSIDKFKHSDELVNLHTGLKTYGHFKYVYNLVSEAAEHMQYWRGSSLAGKTKQYQMNKKKRPGPARKISPENELLLCLMRLKLNCTEAFLASQFGISECSVSRIFSTWVNLLNRELQGLIVWPSAEVVQEDLPECFKVWNGKVRTIIDCTEIPIQKASQTSAKTKHFSYKNTSSVKFLIAYSPKGTITFVSPPSGGWVSDQALAEQCRLVEYFDAGDICMANKGLEIQTYLFARSVELLIFPPAQKGQPVIESNIMDSNMVENKFIARARTHAEKVISRIKNFKILAGDPIQVHMHDLIGPIVNVCCALTNVNPPLL